MRVNKEAFFSFLRNNIKNKYFLYYAPLLSVFLLFLWPEHYLNQRCWTWTDYSHWHHAAMIAAMFIPIIFLSMPRWIGAFFLTVYTAFLAFFCYTALQIGGIGTWNLLAILGTTSGEAFSVVGERKFLLFLCFCFLIGVFYVGLKISRFRPVFLCLSLLWTMGLTAYHWNKWITHAEKDIISSTAFGKVDRFFNIFPGVPGIFIYCAGVKIFYKPAPIALHQKRDEMIKDFHQPQAKNIILVIGESATASRHEFYDPSLLTTPLISKAIAENKACAVKDAHSDASFTQFAVPMIISFESPDHIEKLSDRKNVIELAKEAGYETYWLGRQDSSGPYGESYNYLSKYSDVVIRPDYQKVSFQDGEILRQKFPLNDDFHLLEPLEKSLALHPEKPKFIILHLWGSHGGYRDKSDEADKKALPDSNDYDRSIHHTDRLLAKIIKLADTNLEGKFALFYSSDHGEDTNRQQHGVIRGKITQYQIPVVMAWGDAEKESQKYCDRIEQLRTTDHLFPQTMDKVILLEMMGYEIDSESLKLMAANDHVLHADGLVYPYKEIRTDVSEGHAIPVNLALP